MPSPIWLVYASISGAGCQGIEKGVSISVPCFFSHTRGDEFASYFAISLQYRYEFLSFLIETRTFLGIQGEKTTKYALDHDEGKRKRAANTQSESRDRGKEMGESGGRGDERKK